jgi:hypothetical protein
MLLAAPDSRQWHYDKNYPWIWERAYFQKGTGITIADTELGKIGFLICWDVAHPNLWRQYAGKVELMIVSSCPPKVLDSTLALPDLGMLIQYLRRSSERTFGEYLRSQVRALGVPAAHATSTGIFLVLMEFAVIVCSQTWMSKPANCATNWNDRRTHSFYELAMSTFC